MTDNLITADTAVETLIAEGYDRAAVLAAYDALIDAGLEVQNDDNAITAGDLNVLREQLESDR